MTEEDLAKVVLLKKQRWAKLEIRSGNAEMAGVYARHAARLAFELYPELRPDFVPVGFEKDNKRVYWSLDWRR